MKRIEHIIAEVHLHKTCTRRQVYRYLKLFNISPVGVRQRPQLYPDDAAERILKQLGLIEGPHGTLVNPEHVCGSTFPDDCGRPGCPNATQPARLVTMSELRKERRKAVRRAA